MTPQEMTTLTLRVAELKAENEKLRNAGGLLLHFANHDDDCEANRLMDCTCGYTDTWKRWADLVIQNA